MAKLVFIYVVASVFAIAAFDEKTNTASWPAWIAGAAVGTLLVIVTRRRRRTH